ncbi:MAG TPA: MFS transporter [Ktedonosporobacter sp.]|nr:MFS transporter [Ktedonosporobacter sp.]
MSMKSTNAATTSSSLGLDFWKFWAGQTISNLGSAFTNFALPLLVFKITHSALNLALITALTLLPYLLFGLVIGAWMDRLDRKRVMIITDILRAALIASIPLLDSIHLLFIWWFYVVAFVYSILTIFFDAGQFAAIASLVRQDDLVKANGRIQASYAAVSVIGPLLAGLLLAFIAIAPILLVDSASFLISALSLSLIRISFNVDENKEQEKKSIRQDVVDGLRYVFGHPVLRAISVMMALVNLVAFTTNAQIVLFAQFQFQANDTQIGILYAAAGLGPAVLSLMAGLLRKHWSFSKVALGTLMLYGLSIVTLSLIHWYWAGVFLWGLIWGLSILFNINTTSLRQSMVPNQMLGRVMTTATVLGWSAIPLGTIIGGIVIEQVKNVTLVYGVIGLLIFMIALAFTFTALGHAEQYLPQEKTALQ